MTLQIQQLAKILVRRKREGGAVCYPIPGGGPYLKEVLVALPRPVLALGRPVSTLHFVRFGGTYEIRDSAKTQTVHAGG